MFTVLDVGTFRDRLMECVREKGVQQKEARAELMRVTGLGRANMTHWFNGRAKEPTGPAVIKAALYFGVEPLWLAREEGPKRAKATKSEAAHNGEEKRLLREAAALAVEWGDLSPSNRQKVRRQVQALAERQQKATGRAATQLSEDLWDSVKRRAPEIARAINEEGVRKNLGHRDDRASHAKGSPDATERKRSARKKDRKPSTHAK